MGITPNVGLSSRPSAAESSARDAVGSWGFVMSGTTIGLPAMTRSRLLTFSSTTSMTGNRFTTICPSSTCARLVSPRRTFTTWVWTTRIKPSQIPAKASLA